MSDYPRSVVQGAFTAVKLRNALRRLNPDLDVQLRNVRVNNSLQGCSGFVTDPATGHIVYVCADRNHGTARTSYLRVARSVRDYTGGRNHSSTFVVDELAQAVVDLLAATDEHQKYRAFRV